VQAIHIDVAELHQTLQHGDDIQLVDVREGWEFDIAHLSGAQLIPVHQLEQRRREIDPRRLAVVYCHRGVRSLHAALALRAQGLPNVRSLRGGIDRWSREVDPSVPRY
jgi:rhodanese-related sulfurtransferase